MLSPRLFPRLAAALALALAAAAPPALAGEPPEEVARGLSKRAHEAYRAGNYQEALDLLGAAYRLDPRPVLLYNMGRVLEATDTQAALREYRRCVEQPGCPEGAAERVRVLEEKLREQERTAAAGPGTSRPPTPSAGSAAPPAGAPPAAADVVPSPWPWVVAGAGLAGVAAGVTMGVVASSRHEDARDARSAGPASDLEQQADDLALGTNIALAVGGSLLLAGGVWAVIDLSTRRPPRREAAPSLVLHATATSLSLRARL